MKETICKMSEGVTGGRMFLPQSNRIKWRAVFGSPESRLGALRLAKWDIEVGCGRGMNVYSSSNPSEVQQKDLQYNLIPKKQTITQLKLNGINYLQFCVISFWQSHEIPSLRCGRVYTELWSRKLGTAVGNMRVVRHALSTVSSEATLRCVDHFK